MLPLELVLLYYILTDLLLDRNLPIARDTCSKDNLTRIDIIVPKSSDSEDSFAVQIHLTTALLKMSEHGHLARVMHDKKSRMA